MRKVYYEPVRLIEEKYGNFIVNDPANIVRIERFGHRWYTADGMKDVPSSTTILNSKPNPALENWKKRVGKTKADQISQIAKDTGQEFHSAIESYLKNETHFPENTSEPAIRMFRKVEPYLAQISDIQMIEKPLIGPYYAGTPDCIARFNNKTSIIDFKTSKGGVRNDTLVKYLLQAYSYHKLWEWRYPNWYTTIPHGLVPQQYVIIVGTSEIPEPEIHVFEGHKDIPNEDIAFAKPSKFPEMWRENYETYLRSVFRE